MMNAAERLAFLERLAKDYDEFWDLWQRPEGRKEFRVVRMALDAAIAEEQFRCLLGEEEKKEV